MYNKCVCACMSAMCREVQYGCAGLVLLSGRGVSCDTGMLSSVVIFLSHVCCSLWQGILLGQ